MCAVLNGLRVAEDSWIFEDPVSDSIAPGYSEVIDTPMDYSTVEKRIESNHYQDKDQVRGCFIWSISETKVVRLHLIDHLLALGF